MPPGPPYWKEDVLLWTTGHPYAYMRSTPDGRIMIGGRDDAYRGGEKQNRRLPRKTALLVKDLKSLRPGMEFIPEFSWSGVFGSTPDGLPYIGRYEGDPSIYALGYGGNGITFGQVAARLVGDLICGRKTQELSLFRFDR